VKFFKSLSAIAVFALSLFVPTAPCSAQRPSGWSGDSSRPVIIDFLDIGQGDSILIRSPEGKTALIDAGPSKNGATQIIKRKGITALDIVIVTHHHSDHYGGMGQVVRDFKPKYFMASSSAHTTKGYLNLLQTVKKEGITAVSPTGKLRRIELGSVELTVFPQPREDPVEENNNSIGVRLQYGNFSVLLTGDSETDERQWWMSHHENLVRDCTILKLAHHGSHNGTDQRWLDMVSPEVAVASVGRGNEYGHPHSETVSLLRRNEIPLLRTDLRGTITIISNGRTWNLVDPQIAHRGRSRAPGSLAATSSADEPSSSRPAWTKSLRR
jgi:beta-lactamase superfamily II metal-dependent hydrolase